MDTKKLRQKILDLAIRGKLVPQDPNDEPASVLLERIRAEKERLIAEGKIKRPKKSKASSAESHYQQFEPPFDIPDTWEWVRLDEIGLWQSGATPSKNNPQYYGKGYPWLNTGDLNDGIIRAIPKEITELALQETSVKLNPRGSVLMAMYGATIGKLGILNIDATTNQACCACYKYWINGRFLFYFLLSWRTKFIEMGGGGAQSNISKEKIESTYIPCPPLNEQERIVNQIDALFEFFSCLESDNAGLYALIKQAKSKILDLAMHGKLVPQNSSDEPASDMLLRINPKAKIITDNPHYKVLPKLWILCTLESVANIKSAKRVMKDDWKNDGIPFYRTREIIKLSHDGYVDNQLYISHELYDSYKDKYGVPQTGDIMLTAVGTIGETYIVEKSDQFYYKDASVLCVQPINNLLDSAYFCLFIRSNIAQKQIHNQSKGTTVDTITIEKANNYTFILPPLKEQKRLVAEVEKLYSILDKIEASLQS